jgi:CDP-glucose 4,6-dehydratase|tara:strand:- start:198 stop:1130 length:933 start_codon:yes stop_codon:yes gene_type:complete
MKNILITGINGFVGSSLAEKEVESGNNVIGIVRDVNIKTHKDILDRCTVIRGDIEDIDLLERVVSDYEIDLIYHLAALSIVRIADKNPLNCYRSNIMGTINLLESVRRIKPEIKVVVASSDKAYGTHDTLPYTEDMKLQPDDPYSTSKACADLLAQSYHKTYGMDVNVIRCANIYGPRDMNLSRIIPNTIRKILNNQKPQIYSGVLNFKREFLFIDDVCEAYQLLSNTGVAGEIYNIGDTEFYTIKDLVQEISDIMEFTDGYEVMGKDFLEIPFQYMSADKLKSLGWSKKHSFNQGLVKTIDWYKKIFKK